MFQEALRLDGAQIGQYAGRETTVPRTGEIVTLPPFGLIAAPRECLAVVRLHMKCSPIEEIRSQVKQQQRRIKKLETGKRSLEARVAALNQQVARVVAKHEPKPKRPTAPSAFVLYTLSIRGTLTGSASAQSKQAGARWGALSSAEKQPFKDQHEQAKKEAASKAIAAYNPRQVVPKRLHQSQTSGSPKKPRDVGH